MTPRVSSLVFTCALCAVPLANAAAEPVSPAAAAPAAAAPQAEPLLARIDGRNVITAQAFNETVRNAFRQKFYHAQPPEDEYRQFLKETALKMIDGILLPEEARRRGITPDNAAVEAQLRQLEARYGSSPDWAKRREQAFPGLRKEFERQSVLARLEAQVREVPAPSDAVLEAYYKSHQDIFTEPARFHVSLILLAVDPSSPEATWQAAIKRAHEIRAQIVNGAAFADMARRYSNDQTADNGGDMGYIHQGQLGTEVQASLNNAKTGELLQPIRTLEGIALLRLDELVPKKLRSFADVKERATALYRRETGEQAWKDFLSNLRKSAKVEVGPEYRELLGAEFASHQH